MYQHESISKTCHLMKNASCRKMCPVWYHQWENPTQNSSAYWCSLWVSGPHRPANSGYLWGRKKELGFGGVESVEGGLRHFLVIFQFYFNKENVILLLKCNSTFFLIGVKLLYNVVSFFYTVKWISYTYTYFPSLLDLPPTAPCPCHLTHLCRHRAPTWAPCAIQQVPTSYLFYT